MNEPTPPEIMDDETALLGENTDLKEQLALALSRLEGAEKIMTELRTERDDRIPRSRYDACNSDWLREKERREEVAKNAEAIIQGLETERANLRAQLAEAIKADAFHIEACEAKDEQIDQLGIDYEQMKSDRNRVFLEAADLRAKLETAERERDEALKLGDKVARLTAEKLAHRACCGTEHDPLIGKLHGYCVVCGVPWPCDYSKPESEVLNKLDIALADLARAREALRKVQFYYSAWNNEKALPKDWPRRANNNEPMFPSEIIDAALLQSNQQPKREPCDASGEFYLGIEWLACWMLDHVEGETVTEELLREWATKAWREGKKRQNEKLSDCP